MNRLLQLLTLSLLAASLFGCGENSTTKVSAPISSAETKGANYQTVITKFKEAGFTNVRVEKIEDLVFGWLTKDGEVENVAIGGSTSFSASDQFEPSAQVTITYHTFPAGAAQETHPAPSTQTATPTMPPTTTSASGHQAEDDNSGANASASPTPADEVLTADNNAEFRSLIENPNPNDSEVEHFVAKHKGRIIEFDGHVAHVMRHKNYSTRFDFLIYAGTYKESGFFGPSFKFENCNYYDLKLQGESAPDRVEVGQELHIAAKIIEYSTVSRLLYLKPVSTSTRQ